MFSPHPGFSTWVYFVRMAHLSRELGTVSKKNSSLQKRNRFHSNWHLDFFSKNPSVSGVVAVEVVVIGWLPVVYALCGTWSVIIQRMLHHCASVCSSLPSAGQTQAMIVIKYRKKNHPIWLTQRRIKGMLLLWFLPTELNNTPPAGRKRRRMRGWREMTCRQPWQRMYYTAAHRERETASWTPAHYNLH